MFGNKAPRKIFRPKRDEIIEGWKMHHEEFQNAYSSPNMIIMIKLTRIRRAGHIARMAEKEFKQGFVGKATRKETTRKT
jgi:hypothetical protein